MKPTFRKLVLIGFVTALMSILMLASSVGAQSPGPYALFGHDNAHHALIKIDTATGLATVVGPSGFQSGVSAMAEARGTVPGPAGTEFSAGTLFGLFRDVATGEDFVVAVDVITGEATKVVQTDRQLDGRGIAFGPDGITLYVVEWPGGALSTVDVATGAVTEVGNTGFASASLEWDPDTGAFFAITSANSLISINPADATATIVGAPGSLLRAGTLVRSPTGTWYTVNSVTGELVTINVNTGAIETVVGNLGAAAQAPDGTFQIGATVFAPEEVADLAITKTGAPDPAIAGESLTYTLSVTNDGPFDAPGVTITDPLPAGATFDSATPSQGSCSEAGGTVTCELGTLTVGESATVELGITLDPSLADGATFTNTAEVTGDLPDPDMSDNTATEETTIVRQADLSIAKTGDPDPAVAGDSLTYSLTVSNDGPSDASGVTITDTLPDGATFDSATPSQGSCSEAGGTVTCELGDVAAGASATAEIVVALAPSLPDGGTISNTAEVAANEEDPDPSDNTATEETGVIRQTDLSISKADDPDPVIAGSELTYTLDVTNSGPSDASGVAITDTLPPGARFISGAGCTETASGTVECDVGDLAAGESTSVTLVVAAGCEAVGVITNTAEVAGNETDPNLDNNTAAEDTEVPADFGDAEDPPYPTTAANDGAFHCDPTREWLGLDADTESEANIPDLDEFDDGVFLEEWYLSGNLVRLPILVSTSGEGAARYGMAADRRIYIRGWVDFDGDGDWEDHEMAVQCDVAPGTRGQCNGYPADWTNVKRSSQFFVPQFNIPQRGPGAIWVRVRLSYGAPVGPTGPAAHGEVEDYPISIFLIGDP